MQRIIVPAILVLLASASPAFASLEQSAFDPAPDRTGKWDIGVNVSAAIPADDETNHAAFVGGGISYGINQWLAVGVSAGGASFEMENDIGIFGFTQWGDLNAVPVTADAIFRWQTPENPVVPYAVFGVGGIFYDFEEDSQLEALGVGIEVDSTFATKIGVGLDWFFNQNWAANFEASYYMNDADVEATVNGASVGTADDIDTDLWLVGGGAKYLFT